jgi:hypothetical protein
MNVSCWSNRVSCTAIFPLNLNIKPIPSHFPLSPLHVFPASFLHDLVCIRPIYTLSFFHFFVPAIPCTWESDWTLTAFHEHTATAHAVYPSSLFRLLSHLSISVSSHLIGAGFSYIRFAAFHKLIPIFLSSHLPHFLHLFHPVFDPVSRPLFSWFNVHAPEHAIHTVYNIYPVPVLMCTLPPTRPIVIFYVVSVV